MVIGAGILHVVYQWSSQFGNILGWAALGIWGLIYLFGHVPKPEGEK